MKKVKFATGAERSTDTEDELYDLITPIGLRRVANAYAEGAKKYAAYNWLKGIPASNLLRHSLAHIFHWIEGDSSEDHLGHATWNLLTLMHFEETRPELIDAKLRIDALQKVWREKTKVKILQLPKYMQTLYIHHAKKLEKEKQRKSKSSRKKIQNKKQRLCSTATKNQK